MVSDRQRIDVTRQDRVTVVSFRDDLDLTDEAEAYLALSGALRDTGTTGTLLDLAGLAFADSTTLNVILRAYNEHQDVQRPFVLCGPYQTAIIRLLEITGADGALEMTDGRAEGMRRVRELLGPLGSDQASASDPQ
ncbi:STAS domain-containing protein [Streptomyces sp. NPDC088785]|uniref:STAS domain-containing protein n=1 Tax=Streptomyces sp. NPDC088785 TaxID=3365897 RepID=UPI0038098FED